jgi:hypothetical protein
MKETSMDEEDAWRAISAAEEELRSEEAWEDYQPGDGIPEVFITRLMEREMLTREQAGAARGHFTGRLARRWAGTVCTVTSSRRQSRDTSPFQDNALPTLDTRPQARARCPECAAEFVNAPFSAVQSGSAAYRPRGSNGLKQKEREHAQTKARDYGGSPAVRAGSRGV